MAVYDQFGKEVRVEKKPEMREIAVTAVRDRWSQYPSKGLTPVRLARIFEQADSGDVYSQAELFEEMEEKDPHLFSQLQIRRNAVLSFDYDVVPYSDSTEDKKIADFIGKTIYNLASFEAALLDLLDSIGKGFSLEEIVWDVDGRFAIVKDLRWIHPKKAVFYEYSDTWAKSYEVPKIRTQAEQVKGEAMPPWKLVYHRYKVRSGYDTRAGLLRVCAWMYLFKNYAIKDWVSFCEVYGMPLRLGKYEPGASKEERDALISAVQSLGTDAAGIISKSTEIEFVETIKSSASDVIFEKLADFCDRQTSKAILGQTATSEGTPGMLGSERERASVRQDLVRGDCEALANTIRYQLFRPLVGYNFGWDKPIPWFKLRYEKVRDLKTLSEVYERMHRINFPMSIEHISERFKIPLPAKGETLLRQDSGGQGIPGQEPMKREITDRRPMPLKSVLPESQEKIDSITDRILKEGGIEEFRLSLERIVNQATSLEDLRARILDRFRDVEIERMREILPRAIQIADLMGRISV